MVCLAKLIGQCLSYSSESYAFCFETTVKIPLDTEIMGK